MITILDEAARENGRPSIQTRSILKHLLIRGTHGGTLADLLLTIAIYYFLPNIEHPLCFKL